MSLARTLAVMRKAPFLSALGDEGLKLLAFGIDPINLKPRQSLFEAGEPAEHAIMVLGGQLRLIPDADNFAPTVCSVGDLVDEMALLVPMERSASAIAQTSCEVIPLPRTQMLRILNEYPDAAQRLQRAIASRTNQFVDELTALSDRLR
ncbi:MAG: cyclic nucleotide-binding domain-containing protein [Pseudomonadota bacterium]